MAKVTFAPGQPTLSGRVGNLIYRQTGGKTVVARAARPPAEGWSAAQQANRDVFRAAAAYARDVLADPLQAEGYVRLAKAKNRPVMSILVADYRTPPTIERIDDTAYHGSAGDLIRLLATDDLEVVSVHLTLHDRQGTVIEQGPATRIHDVWTYRAQTTLPPGEPVTIEAIATDRPQHEGKASKAWMPDPAHG